MNRKTKFISNRANKPRKHTGGLVVLDAKQLASEIAKIVEASFYKHNNMPSAKSYHFAMKSLPKILEDFYPQDYRRLRNAGLIRNRLLTGRINELENVKKAAFTTFIGKLVAPDVMGKADFRLYGKHKIEMVLKRIEIGTGERNSSNFRDGHVTMPMNKPKIDEEDMSNQGIATALNEINLKLAKAASLQTKSHQSLMSEVGGLKDEVGVLKDEVGGLRGEVGGLRGEVGGLRGEVVNVKEKVEKLTASFKDADLKVDAILKHFGIPIPKTPKPY